MKSQPTKLTFAVFCLVPLVGIFGCYQRDVPPEIQYSNADVELIRKEIQDFEWD